MKLTDKQKIDIVAEYQAGATLLELAVRYNVTHPNIISILEVRGIKRRARTGK